MIDVCSSLGFRSSFWVEPHLHLFPLLHPIPAGPVPSHPVPVGLVDERWEEGALRLGPSLGLDGSLLTWGLTVQLQYWAQHVSYPAKGVGNYFLFFCPSCSGVHCSPRSQSFCSEESGKGDLCGPAPFLGVHHPGWHYRNSSLRTLSVIVQTLCEVGRKTSKNLLNL